MFARILDHFLPRHAWMWRYRHWWNRKFFKSYTIDPHRLKLLQKIINYEPFHSVLEFGCGNAMNLALLRVQKPDSALFGIDKNRKAIKSALSKWNKPGEKYWKDLHLTIGDFHNIYFDLHLKNIKFDIFLTDSTLIYANKSELMEYIKIFKWITKKALIFCEWHSENNGSFFDGHWVHNFKKLLPGSRITKFPKGTWNDPGWEKYGSIIEYKV